MTISLIQTLYMTCGSGIFMLSLGTIVLIGSRRILKGIKKSAYEGAKKASEEVQV